MRRCVGLAVLASAVLAAPAVARDNEWYVGGDYGLLKVQNLKYDLTQGGAKTSNGIVVHSHYGFESDGVVGYDFGAFRVEVEGGYKRAEVKNIGIVGGTFCSHVACTPAGLQGVGRYGALGNTQVMSALVNGMFEFGADDGLQGFVGGGVGGARVKAGINRLANQVILLDDRDTRFAWQGIAGIRAPLTRHIDVTIKYRFFNVENVKFTAGNGSAADTSLPIEQPRERSHLQFRRDCRAAASSASSASSASPSSASPSAAAPAGDTGAVHRVLRLGQVGHHAGGRFDPRQCGAGLCDDGPGFGHARRPRRQVGFGQLQRWAVAAPCRCGEGLFGRTWRARCCDVDRIVR